MNNEIKEILDYLKESAIKKNLYFEIKPEKAQILLDYITNLQQEINKLTAESTEWESKCYELQQAKDELQNDYQEAVDKICELKQENERLKELNENASKVCIAEHKYGVDKAEEARDYKSRCEKISEIIKKEKEIMGYAKYDSCLLLIENILQNGSEDK